MLKIVFSPLSTGSGTQVIGDLPTASGDLYLQKTGGNTVTGPIRPTTHDTLSIGQSGLAFASGSFKSVFLDTQESGVAGSVSSSGVRLTDVVAVTFVEWFIRNPADSTYYPCTALRMLTTSSGVAMSGSQYQMINTGAVKFYSAGTPTITADPDVNLHRKQAGWVRVGTSTTESASGAIEAGSGVFKSGVVMRIGGGVSGSVVKVDNNGLLTVTGPFNV